jgi:diketogulonate reductase-like aldo/keto reductase
LIQQGGKYLHKLGRIAEVDTYSYGTEPAVGRAIKQSGVPRSEIFVTSKLWNNKHHPDDVEQALQMSLDDLGLDYLDLFLMHWPVAFKRGDDLFPSDKDGNLITDDIDYVDVFLSNFNPTARSITDLSRLTKLWKAW